MKLSRSKLSLLFISILFGSILAIQLKSAINILGFNIYPNQKMKELVGEYEVAQERLEQAQAELEEIESEIREHERIEAEGNELIEKYQRELKAHRIFIGYEDVSGPGVSITIEDPDIKTEDDRDISFIVENYNYILQIITILNDNGAEAIGINGERYTNFTELIPDGSALIVNGERVSPPIVITAIGSTEKLERGLSVRGNTIWEMKNLLYYDVTISREENVSIKKYDTEEEFQYAKPFIRE